MHSMGIRLMYWRKSCTVFYHRADLALHEGFYWIIYYKKQSGQGGSSTQTSPKSDLSQSLKNHIHPQPNQFTAKPALNRSVFCLKPTPCHPYQYSNFWGTRWSPFEIQFEYLTEFVKIENLYFSASFWVQKCKLPIYLQSYNLLELTLQDLISTQFSFCTYISTRVHFINKILLPLINVS